VFAGQLNEQMNQFWILEFTSIWKIFALRLELLGLTSGSEGCKKKNKAETAGESEKSCEKS
jgi:hypothetical protein